MMKMFLQLLLLVSYLFSTTVGEQAVMHLCSSESCSSCGMESDDCCGGEAKGEASGCCSEVVIQVHNYDNSIIEEKTMSVNVVGEVFNDFENTRFASLPLLAESYTPTYSDVISPSTSFQNYHLLKRRIVYS